MRLVDDQQEILREVVDQRGGRRPGRPGVDVARVVLDAGAEPDLAHHLDVVVGPHPQPLRLQQLALALQFGEPLLEFLLDGRDRVRHPLRARHVVGGREDPQRVDLADDVTGQRMQVVQRLDLVAEELDAYREFLVGRDDLDSVAAHAERAAGERHVVAGVLDVDQQPQQRVAGHLYADLQLDRSVQVGLRRAEAVDAGHRCDHDDVAAREQARRRRVPQPLHVVVDRAVLLDVGVGLGDVRLGLVVVVVRDEVLDGVVRQHFPQLVGELRGQRLVGRHHQRGPLQPLDQPRGRGRLAGAGGAQQHHVALPCLDPALQLLDGGGLVTGGCVLADHLESAAGAHDVLDGAVLRVRQHGVFGSEGHGHQGRTTDRHELFPSLCLAYPRSETREIRPGRTHQHRSEGDRAGGGRVHGDAVGAVYGPPDAGPCPVPLPGVVAAAVAGNARHGLPLQPRLRTRPGLLPRCRPVHARPSAWHSEDHYLDLVVRTGEGVDLSDVDELLDRCSARSADTGSRRTGRPDGRRRDRWPVQARVRSRPLAGRERHDPGLAQRIDAACRGYARSMSFSRYREKRPAGRSPEGEYADGRSEPVPTWRSPTLATLTDERFSDPDWIFERKLDGVRCLAFRNGRKVRLLSRNRQSLNGTYPEVLEALAAQKCSKFVVDGEIVAFEGRRTSFARLQGRLGITDPEHALASGIAVFYYLFDLIHLDGKMTTDLPLTRRKRLLRNAFEFEDPLRYTTHRVRDGEAAFDAACKRGDEGIIAKLADAPYEGRRSSSWLKFKCRPRPGVRHRRLHRPEGQPRRTWRAPARLSRR